MAEEAERPSGTSIHLLNLIVKIETERAENYRNSLLQLANGNSGTGAPRVLPGGALIRPNLGAPLEQAICRPPAEQGRVNRPQTGDEVANTGRAQAAVPPRPPTEQGRVDRDNRPEIEVEVAITRQAQAAVPSGGGTSSTGIGGPSRAPQPTTRGRDLVSHGGSAIRSKRTPLRHSFNIVIPPSTANRLARIQPRRTNDQANQQRNQVIPNPSPFVFTGTNGRRSFISLEEVLTRAGVTPLRLTGAEAIRSEETPGVDWLDICKVFGGTLRAEWPDCRKIPGYKTLLCADHRTQPYLQPRAGEPGLILCPPHITHTPEDENTTFNVFLCSPQDNRLYYQGEYTKVPLRQIQVSFCDLPDACRKLWILRLKNAHAPIRARIKLRNEHDREPSAARVLEYVRCHPTASATQKEIYDAFMGGEEKMLCYAVQCTAYDSGLATIIQRVMSGTPDYS